MLRAVLDANVVVSAFLQPRGPSGRILRAFVDKRAFELVLSTAILEEIGRALRYPRVRKRLGLREEEIQERVAALGVLADLAEGVLDLHPVSDDPDDDKYFWAALQGRAELVVSGDRHLLDVGEFQGVQVLPPRKFLDLLE